MSGQLSPNGAMPEALQDSVTKSQTEEVIGTEAPNQAESNFVYNQSGEVTQMKSSADEIDSTKGQATNSPTPIDSQVDDEPMDTNEGEEEGEEFEETGGEEEGNKTGSTRKGKIHPRNPQYPSIIRTRRASGMDSIKQQSKHVNSADESLQNTVIDETTRNDANISDVKEKRSTRGRGRGGGGSTLKRYKISNEKETAVEECVGKGSRGRGKIALVTRAAAAVMKGIQFHQLPRRPKRQKTREEECEDEEEMGPLSKKNKIEKDNAREEEETALVAADGDKEGIKSSPYKGKSGRGRGRRSRNGGKIEEDTEEKKNEDNEDYDKMGVVDKQEDKQQIPVKKKRGRPKKKAKEVIAPTTTDTPTAEESCEDLNVSQQQVAEPVKDVQEIVELLELSENMGNEDKEITSNNGGVSDSNEKQDVNMSSQHEETDLQAMEPTKKNDGNISEEDDTKTVAEEQDNSHNNNNNNKDNNNNNKDNNSTTSEPKTEPISTKEGTNDDGQVKKSFPPSPNTTEDIESQDNKEEKSIDLLAKQQAKENEESIKKETVEEKSKTDNKTAISTIAAAGDKDGIPTGNKDGVPTGDKDGVHTGDKDGVPIGNKDGVHTGNKDGVPTGNKDGVHTGNKDGVHTGNKDGVPTGNKDGVHTGYKDGVHTGNKDGVHTGNKDGVHAGYKDGVHTGYKDGVHTGNKDGVHAGYKDGVHTGNKDGVPTGNKDGVPTESQQPPTTAPLEPTYPFPTHRFSPLDEQGFHHFPMPHPFLTGYPPFSSPPYPTFMLPTSPHFPQSPYPPECLPPDMYPRFPEEFGRYTLPPIPTSAGTTTSQASESVVSIVDTPPNSTSPTSASSHATCIPMSLPLSQGYTTFTLPSHPYGPPPIIGTGMPPPIIGTGMPPPMLPAGEWNMGPPQAPPHVPPPAPPPTSVPSAKTTKETRFPLSLVSSDEPTTSVTQPVDCPECGRHFKNNKALNGHMRLHGGFDWTRRPYQVMQNRQQQLAREAEKKAVAAAAVATTTNNNSTDQTDNGGSTTEQHKKGTRANKQQSLKNGLKGSSQQNLSPPESRHSGTLEDLCRAAEELERIERNGFKNKPIPLILPHEKRLQSFSPPYTPPPILSPARSLMMLSSSTERLNSSIVSHVATSDNNNIENLPTPSKIWPQRKVSDQRPVDQDELFEPKINIGAEFQAELPSYQDKTLPYEHVNAEIPLSSKAILTWSPLEGLLQEDEDTIDGFLELSCSPAIPNGGRNKELALHILHQAKGSVKEAVRLMVMGKTTDNNKHNTVNYNYTGSKRWSSKERQQFRRAWRVHRKQFQQIQNQVETKSLPEIIEYYYSWKKYCPDEYRGRNRHHSEEVLSEEDGDIYVHPSSVASTSSGSNDADNNLSLVDNENHNNPPVTKSSNHTEGKPSLAIRHKTTPSKGSIHIPSEVMEHLPRGFMSSQQSPFGATVQEYRCKYPGCNQVYTSIFALNGHIRVHGGSWYPKKPDVENMQSSSKEFAHPNSHHPATHPYSNFPLSKLKKEKDEEDKLRHQLEIAKTMVMDLPQPRSPAQNIISHTPSPRPSPSHGKSSLIKSKKVSSASPSDREGHYPCNRCGRVFPKVKSRSAHMKSHIVKPVKH